MVKQFAIDYPEYKTTKVDETKLMSEKPELFDKVVSTTLVLTKAQEKVVDAKPQVAESGIPEKVYDDLPF